MRNKPGTTHKKNKSVSHKTVSSHEEVSNISPFKDRKKGLLLFLRNLLICQGAGIIGSLATIPNIATWYASLVKPFYTPPNWVFSPVWITLYFLMAVSVTIIQLKKSDTLWFWIQLFLNTAWTFIFFDLKATGPAFGVILLLWLSIVMTIIRFWPVDRRAAGMLIPYLLWVSYASFLNMAIWQLN